LPNSKACAVPPEFQKTGLAAWLLEVEGDEFCVRFNQLNPLIWRLPITMAWDGSARLYIVSDQATRSGTTNLPVRIAIARRERLFRYRRGVGHRVRKLAGKYFLDRMTFTDGDVVIDCGANVGEIGLYVRAQADVRMTAVEPSETEAAACDANLFDGRRETYRYALWHSEEELTFYDSNASGDSSLIPPAEQHAGTTTINATTLEKLISEAEVERIKLLKIEGEGAEPEILEGGRAVLSQVDNCAVDCGPERGVDRDHVIPQVVNLMTGAGFEVVDVNLERQIFWFRNPLLF
jgi:FkbM family methyltransferase